MTVKKTIMLLTREGERPDWQKAFLMIVYFLVLGLANLIGLDGAFYVLAWPLYVFPRWTILAAAAQLLFAYAISSAASFFIKRALAKKPGSLSGR